MDVASLFPNLGQEVFITGVMENQLRLRRVGRFLGRDASDRRYLPPICALHLDHVVRRQDRDGVAARRQVDVRDGECKGYGRRQQWPLLRLKAERERAVSNRTMVVVVCMRFMGVPPFLSAGESG